MEKGWLVSMLAEIEDELTEVLEELLGSEDMTLEEQPPTRATMREMFEVMRGTEGGTEDFIEQNLQAGKTPEEIVGWLAKEANLAVRRDGRQ